jgi:tRNA A-37 threonylcarbamoyl transferase component Bud32
MAFVVGATIGQYRIVEQLGQGGMATVFKAYHPALDRYVAIKALHPAFTDDENFLKRFEREAKMVARLDHPNIVPIYDFSEHEGRPYLVMKYIEGQTLKASLSRQKLSNEEILRIVGFVGKALAYAHQQGVLHRDIKPSNVLITDDGQVYLADFGLARIVQTGESSLTADRMVGTPQYMSPEQAQALPNLDARSDIYSLGVMLYELMVGKVPYNADTPFAIIHDHIYSPLPMPHDVQPNIAPDIERVLLKALAKNPDDRFSSVVDLIRAFRAAVRGEKLPAFTIPPTIDTALTPPPSTLVTDRAGGQAATQVAAPAVEKRKTKVWPIIVGVSGLIVVCVLVILAMGAFNNSINQQAQRTLDAEAQMFQQEALSELDIARERMGFAIDAWLDEDLGRLHDEIDFLRGKAIEDPQFRVEVLNYFRDNQAWFPLALLMYDPGQPELLTGQFLETFHQAIYSASDDPIAGGFIHANADRELFRVAVIRNDLYYSDIDFGILKDDLGGLIEDPAFVRRFPEARLLEAEMFNILADERYNQILDELISNNNLPAWVRETAREYKKIFN